MRKKHVNDSPQVNVTTTKGVQFIDTEMNRLSLNTDYGLNEFFPVELTRMNNKNTIKCTHEIFDE